jgi:hypothetical protein
MLSVAGRFVAHDFTPIAALASGPILEARSAGSHAASSATANSITSAQADTAASHGSTPNSGPAIRRLSPKAAGMPTAMPARARFAPCQTKPKLWVWSKGGFARRRLGQIVNRGRRRAPQARKGRYHSHTEPRAKEYLTRILREGDLVIFTQLPMRWPFRQIEERVR